MARGPVGLLNGCLSPSEGVGRCFCERHRIDGPMDEKKTCVFRSSNIIALRRRFHVIDRVYHSSLVSSFFHTAPNDSQIPTPHFRKSEVEISTSNFRKLKFNFQSPTSGSWKVGSRKLVWTLSPHAASYFFFVNQWPQKQICQKPGAILRKATKMVLGAPLTS